MPALAQTRNSKLTDTFIHVRCAAAADAKLHIPAGAGKRAASHDMIGMFDWTPKFVRRYGKVRDLIAQAVEAYAADVGHQELPVATRRGADADGPDADGSGDLLRGTASRGDLDEDTRYSFCR